MVPFTLSRVVGEPRIGVEAGFQHAVELDQVAAHARLVVADRLDRRRGPAGDHHPERGHVEACELRIVEQRHDRGRRGGDIADALGGDQLERRARREPLHQHRAAAGHDRLQQAQIAPVEAHRQIDELHVLLGHQHVAVDLVDCRQRGVEGMQHAFGIAGRARRERHAKYLVGTHGLARGGGKRDGGGDSLLERPDLVGRIAGAAQDDDMLEPRQAGAQLARHGDVIETLELAGADEGAAPREAQDVVELAHPEVGIDLVGDRADQLEGEEGDRKGDAVGQLDGDDVALPDADSPEERGAAHDPVPELAIADPAGGVGKHLAFRMRRGALLQDREKSLVRPQARPPIALGELGLHHGLERHVASGLFLGHRTARNSPPSTAIVVPVV